MAGKQKDSTAGRLRLPRAAAPYRATPREDRELRSRIAEAVSAGERLRQEIEGRIAAKFTPTPGRHPVPQSERR